MTAAEFTLPYEEFETFVASLERTGATTKRTTEDGRSVAAFEIREWFLRCVGRPIPLPALCPRSTSCEPRRWASRAHWENWFLTRARWRTGRSDLGARTSVVLGPGSRRSVATASFEDAVATLAARSDLGATDATRTAAAGLRTLATDHFRSRRRYRAEIEGALQTAIDELAAGTATSLVIEVGDILKERFPTEFAGGRAEDKACSRAREDVRAFLMEFGPRVADPAVIALLAEGPRKPQPG